MSKLTAETITAEQIRIACAVSSREERGRFGSAANLCDIASRFVGDADARRVYGERGVRNTHKARALCASILNALAAGKGQG